MTPPYHHSLGLTGGIACGKSTAASCLESYGWARVDADREARRVVEPGSEGLAEVVKRFGARMLDRTGRLDRQRLARAVFSDAGARAELEAVLHPRIWKRLAQARDEAESSGVDTVFEIPLLFENGRQDQFTEVWSVVCSPQEQHQRLLLRPGLDEQMAKQILEAQLPLEEKARRAHLALDSSGSLEEFQRKVQRAHQDWKERRRLEDAAL